MRSLFVVLFSLLALQSAYTQCIPSAVLSPVIQSNSVATTLADTLSLLTVSSLLAETLPYNCPMVAPIAPIGPVASIAPVVGGCGAPIAPVVGGCGCGGFGYPYGTYVI